MSEATNVETPETATDNTNAGEHVDTKIPASEDIELRLGKDKADDPTDEEKPDETKPDPEKAEEKEPEKAEEKEPEKAEDATPDLYVVPDMPDGFTIADEAKTALFEVGKKHNLTQPALNDLVAEHVKAVESGKDAQAETALKQWEDTQKQWDTELTKDWGDDKEKNMILMNKVVTRFTQDNQAAVDYMFGKSEDGKTIPPNPAVAKMLLEVAKVMSPDTLETGQLQTKQNRNLKDSFSDLNKQYKT